MAIPKKIHYCWFGGNPKPDLAIKCIKSWKKYCPDFEIIEFNGPYIIWIAIIDIAQVESANGIAAINRASVAKNLSLLVDVFYIQNPISRIDLDDLSIQAKIP